MKLQSFSTLIDHVLTANIRAPLVGLVINNKPDTTTKFCLANKHCSTSVLKLMVPNHTYHEKPSFFHLNILSNVSEHPPGVLPGNFPPYGLEHEAQDWAQIY